MDFFSSGIMRKNSEGEWILEYSSENEYRSYNDVVITVETADATTYGGTDDTPETHILEGSF